MRRVLNELGCVSSCLNVAVNRPMSESCLDTSSGHDGRTTMNQPGDVATSLSSGFYSSPGFASDADALAAIIICLAIAVAAFELARGAWDRRRIKVRRKG